MSEINLQKGLVGHWKMDEEDTDDEVIRDGTPHDNYGALVSSVETGQSSPVGSSYEFDGDEGFVDFGENNAFKRPSDGDWSVSIWIWVRENSSDVAGNTNAGIFGNRRNSTNTWEVWHWEDRGIYIELCGDDNSRDRIGSAPINFQQWYHVVVIYYGGSKSFSLYIDTEHIGDEDYTDTGHFDSSSRGVIAERSGDSTRRFPGRISDARIYNRALSEKEIKALYNVRNRMVRQG